MSDDKSPLLSRPDYLICTCMGVMYSEIIGALEDGCSTFADLSERLLVGTGCNSCVPEITEIVQEFKIRS